HPAGGGERARGGRWGGAGGGLVARRERGDSVRGAAGGGRAGAGGLPVRRAGALRRGPAGGRARRAGGRGGGVGAADRDPGGLSMAAWLQPDLTTMALCWRLDRRDGVALGFTSHDRDLPIGGIVYRAAPGMVP